jgi:hypothetical protein
MSEPVVKSILFCNYYTLDIRGRISLIDIFGTMAVRAVPAPSSEFLVYVHAFDVPRSPTLLFQVENSSGMVVWTSGPIPFENNSLPHLQYVCTVNAWTVVALGKYRVAFYINSDRVAEAELEVEMATEGAPT